MEKVNELALVLAQATVEFAKADREFQRCKDDGLTEADPAFRSWKCEVSLTRYSMECAQTAMYKVALDKVAANV